MVRRDYRLDGHFAARERSVRRAMPAPVRLGLEGEPMPVRRLRSAP
jgi:hypothetical protein